VFWRNRHGSYSGVDPMAHQDAPRSKTTRRLTAEAIAAAEAKLGRPLTAVEKAEATEKLRAVLDGLEEPRALDARLEHAADLLESE
jgi:hypothetical protein